MIQRDIENNDEQRYKTISSAEETRNQTTNKKQMQTSGLPRQRPSPNSPNTRPYYIDRIQERRPRKKSPSQSLRHSLQELKSRREQLLSEGKYNKASAVDARIHRTMSLIVHSELNCLRKSQSKEKQKIRWLHLNEMKHFRQEDLKEKQRINSLKEIEKREVREARLRLQAKFQVLRRKSGQMVDLQRRQQAMLKRSDYRELSLIKRQKMLAAQKLQNERQATIAKWIRQEDRHIEHSNTLRYDNLILKMREGRMDKEKEYNREEKRLKQKYRNVLRQLEHEQKIELNSFVKTHNQLLAGPVLL